MDNTVTVTYEDVKKFLNNMKKQYQDIISHTKRIQSTGIDQISSGYKSVEGYDFVSKVAANINKNIGEIGEFYVSLTRSYKQAAVVAAGGAGTSLGQQISQINVSYQGISYKIKNHGTRKKGQSKIKTSTILRGIRRVYVFIADIQKNLYDTRYIIKNQNGVLNTPEVTAMLENYCNDIQRQINDIEEHFTGYLEAEKKKLQLSDAEIKKISSQYSYAYKSYSDYAAARSSGKAMGALSNGKSISFMNTNNSSTKAKSSLKVKTVTAEDKIDTFEGNSGSNSSTSDSSTGGFGEATDSNSGNSGSNSSDGGIFTF